MSLNALLEICVQVKTLKPENCLFMQYFLLNQTCIRQGKPKNFFDNVLLEPVGLLRDLGLSKTFHPHLTSRSYRKFSVPPHPALLSPVSDSLDSSGLTPGAAPCAIAGSGHRLTPLLLFREICLTSYILVTEEKFRLFLITVV